MKYSVLILTWNRRKLIELTLKALENSLENMQEEYEVLICDNGSTDGTTEYLREYLKTHKNCKGIFLKKNKGINSYKKLFKLAKGNYIIELDDDVIDLPKDFLNIFDKYFCNFDDYGVLSLNVIQDEKTNGAKPESTYYTEDTRKKLTVERGPAGGWCLCIRKKEFDKIKLLFTIKNMNMKLGEDGWLCILMKHLLHKKIGIIKDFKCLHACGPWYAKYFNNQKREIEKYLNSGLTEFAEWYKEK